MHWLRAHGHDVTDDGWALVVAMLPLGGTTLPM
jgi:hypothetical protein